LAGGAAVLAVTYLALLFPEPVTVLPDAASKETFAWKQDAFWAELEKQFNQARATGCTGVVDRITDLTASVHAVLDRISKTTSGPEAPAFSELEAGIFRLAPLIAACPQHLADYMTLMSRLRAEVKGQSQNWELNAAARDRLYRLLYGSRIALEEVMLQAPAGSDLPRTAQGQDVASRTPPAPFLGAQIHSGDILLSRGGAPTSALIARGNDYPGVFSHAALVYVDESNNQPLVVESHIESGVVVSTLDQYLADKKLRIVALRLRPDLPEMIADPMLPHKAAAAVFAAAKSHHIPYDFAMDHRQHDAQFCSEVASAAYEAKGIHLWKAMTFISSPTVRAWLGSVGARNFETQEPSELEYDPQVAVAGEWRERDTLFKAHVDDAVIDIMLEEAAAGEPLPYPMLMLPASRLAKAYSFVLNRLGKIGPIPEGMSATAALRVKRYRDDHARIADRVLQGAAEFQKSNGYLPPFWELRRLAHEAKKEKP
jgi:hypothetical protein